MTKGVNTNLVCTSHDWEFTMLDECQLAITLHDGTRYRLSVAETHAVLNMLYVCRREIIAANTEAAAYTKNPHKKRGDWRDWREEATLGSIGAL